MCLGVECGQLTSLRVELVYSTVARSRCYALFENFFYEILPALCARCVHSTAAHAGRALFRRGKRDGQIVESALGPNEARLAIPLWACRVEFGLRIPLLASRDIASSGIRAT